MCCARNVLVCLARFVSTLQEQRGRGEVGVAPAYRQYNALNQRMFHLADKQASRPLAPRIGLSRTIPLIIVTFEGGAVRNIFLQNICSSLSPVLLSRILDSIYMPTVRKYTTVVLTCYSSTARWRSPPDTSTFCVTSHSAACRFLSCAGALGSLSVILS